MGGQDNTLIEAPAKRESCLMCCPCLPMIAPTDSAGINRWTVSVSDCCWERWTGHTCLFDTSQAVTVDTVMDAFSYTKNTRIV